MQYETGMLLWGASKAIGNIWVVTSGPIRQIALVFDGKNKRPMIDVLTTKFDTIAPTSHLYELSAVEYGYIRNTLPLWADTFIKQRPLFGIKPPIGNSMSGNGSVVGNLLAPAVVKKVQQALNINLTPESGPAILPKDETKCVNGGEHKFVPYTGLNHSFEFCVTCDKKRGKSV